MVRSLMSKDLAARRRSAGVSLVEVLVAVTILGLGVLSIVALQLVSKRANSDANAQSLASQLAYNMVERMRMNDSTVALTQYEILAANGIGRGQQGSTPNPACNAAGATCNAAQLAAYDVWFFEQQLDGNAEVITGTTTGVGGLVTPTACIAGPNGGGAGIYTISIAWRSKTPLPVDATIQGNCGLGLGLYGAVGSECTTDADCLRRTIQVQVFIS